MTRLFSAAPVPIWNHIVNNQYGCRITTGQYTGDGTLSQPITGLGFQPRYVAIWRHFLVESAQDSFRKIDQMTTDLAERPANGVIYDNKVISLDADGFTVDDDGANGDPNINAQLYDFMALG